jgi:hypothetical protein
MPIRNRKALKGEDHFLRGLLPLWPSPCLHRWDAAVQPGPARWSCVGTYAQAEYPLVNLLSAMDFISAFIESRKMWTENTWMARHPGAWIAQDTVASKV